MAPGACRARARTRAGAAPTGTCATSCRCCARAPAPTSATAAATPSRVASAGVWTCCIDDPGRYLRRLRGDVVELERLREDLLSGVSVFFRDPEAFRILDAEALQPLLEANASGMPIRIWVPGCATGEEAYGIAMLLESQLENRGGSRDGVRVYATDIDDAALRQARRGEYSVAALRNVSLGWRRRFFDAIDERTYRVKESLRDRVLFASHNLLTDSPFSRLDLICCRNLLDLFDAPVRDYLLERLHAALNPGGWLLLGSDDTPVVGIGLFEPVAKRWRLYRRVAADGASVAAGPGPQPSAPWRGGPVRARRVRWRSRHARGSCCRTRSCRPAP